MILISGLKQLQNTAAFHNEERNHSNMWGGRGRGEGRGGRVEREDVCMFC